MDGSIIFFFAAILIVAGALLTFISFNKRSSVIDVQKYRSKWLSIEQQLRPDEAHSHPMVVLNADKLLDSALKEHGISGETMGERMKNARNKWTNANAVWAAHKLRNRIAHETDVDVGYHDAKRALVAFRQALKDIGAI